MDWLTTDEDYHQSVQLEILEPYKLFQACILSWLVFVISQFKMFPYFFWRTLWCQFDWAMECIFLRECFWVKLTFKWVNWVKQIDSLMWVSLIHSIEGLTGTKTLTLSLIRENYYERHCRCCTVDTKPDCLQTGTWVFFFSP